MYPRLSAMSPELLASRFTAPIFFFLNCCSVLQRQLKTSADLTCLKKNTKHIHVCSFTLWLISPPLLSYSILSKFSNPLSAIQSFHFLTFFTRLVYPSLLTSWPRDSLRLLCFSLILPQLSWKPSPSPSLPQDSCHLLVLMFCLPFLNFPSPPLPWCQDTDSLFLLFLSPLPFGHQYLNCYSVKQQAFDFPLWDILHSSLLHSLVRLM